MRVKIYRKPSGFWNVPDPCSFDRWAEDLFVHEIEVPDSFRVYENTRGQTVMVDNKGNLLEPEYVYRKGNTPLDNPYIALGFLDEYERYRYYKCKILSGATEQ